MSLATNIDEWAARVEPYVWTALRVVSGGMLSFHGLQKVFGVLGRDASSLGSQMWIGGVIELVCGVLIAVGLVTRAASFLASGTMAVAYIQFHWKLELGDRFLPIINKGELAALYCFVFLLFAARGAGPHSVDQILRRR